MAPDTDRLGHIAVQEGHAVGGLRVFGMVGEDEHRPLPCAVDAADVCVGVEVIPTSQHGAGRLRVLVDKGLQGLGRYRSPDGEGPPGIVFGFGDVNQDAIRRGIAAIGDLLQGYHA
jgi:hypothetical protein